MKLNFLDFYKTFVQIVQLLLQITNMVHDTYSKISIYCIMGMFGRVNAWNSK